MDKNIGEELIEKTLKKMDGAYAKSTLRAYRSDMDEFLTYCNEVNSCALPAQPQQVADFVLKTSGDSHKAATIRRKVSSISALHRLSNLVDPTKHSDVKLAIRKMHRALGRNSGQAHGVTKLVLETLMTAAGSERQGKRDKVLLLLGYDTLRRRAELVSLRIDDIEWIEGGAAAVLLRKSKTDQEGTGKYLHLSARTCEAIHEWMAVVAISDGFILRGLNRGEAVSASLGEGQISRIYKRLARQAGIDSRVVAKISGHSLRVGGAQDMLRAGASLPQIMVKGGWSKTDTVMRYVEKTLLASPHM